MVASILKIGISQNPICDNLVGFPKSYHIYTSFSRLMGRVKYKITKSHYIQWNLHIIHILGTTKCPDYQGALMFQATLYDKAPFGTVTKCVDYVSRCP